MGLAWIFQTDRIPSTHLTGEHRISSLSSLLGSAVSLCCDWENIGFLICLTVGGVKLCCVFEQHYPLPKCTVC